MYVNELTGDVYEMTKEMIILKLREIYGSVNNISFHEDYSNAMDSKVKDLSDLIGHRNVKIILEMEGENRK